ncbi:hypothetical protein E2C01_077697 [Portunus trituberculatus]|uniref:Uncharacterized protein n=1 Tax=Portunus trituberculatus TaxID=210409 RepID=A0A5B7IQE3_PORTR|nr:hypothetical protein [Portunus trituberculatus]
MQLVLERAHRIGPHREGKPRTTNQPPVTEEGAVGSGAEGDSRVDAAGPADVALRVTDSQVAGVWSGGAGREGASPSLPMPGHFPYSVSCCAYCLVTT